MSRLVEQVCKHLMASLLRPPPTRPPGAEGIDGRDRSESHWRHRRDSHTRNPKERSHMRKATQRDAGEHRQRGQPQAIGARAAALDTFLSLPQFCGCGLRSMGVQEACCARGLLLLLLLLLLCLSLHLCVRDCVSVWHERCTQARRRD